MGQSNFLRNGFAEYNFCILKSFFNLSHFGLVTLLKILRWKVFLFERFPTIHFLVSTYFWILLICGKLHSLSLINRQLDTKITKVTKGHPRKKCYFCIYCQCHSVLLPALLFCTVSSKGDQASPHILPDWTLLWYSEHSPEWPLDKQDWNCSFL